MAKGEMTFELGKLINITSEIPQFYKAANGKIFNMNVNRQLHVKD